MLLCAFQLFNVQLLLLSGIGKPYDPHTGKGVIGRNYTYQTISTAVEASSTRQVNFNPFVASGAIGMCIDEFNGDNFDHGTAWLRRRRLYGPGADQRPSDRDARRCRRARRPGARNGKGGARQLSELGHSRRGLHGSLLQLSRRTISISIPTYKDRFGRPLMRMTFDFHDNELKMSAYLDRQIRGDRAEDGRRAGRQAAAQRALRRRPTIRQRISAAARSWATNPRQQRARTRYLQSWDVPNLFVQGATAFPQNAGYNPTGTVGALAFWSADAIRTQYLKNPGPLVHA